MGSSELVLIHGAYHGPWCWEYVVEYLERAGVTATSVCLPFTGFADDVKHVKAVLGRSGTPTVVCGHSYGGRVMAEASSGDPSVAHLVYLAAFMLSEEQLITFRREQVQDWRRSRARPGSWDKAAISHKFYGDCGESEAAKAYERLRPMKEFGAFDGLSARPWEMVASTYVICSRDESLRPSWQYGMAENATYAVELKAGHSPFISDPATLAGVLANIVKHGRP